MWREQPETADLTLHCPRVRDQKALHLPLAGVLSTIPRGQHSCHSRVVAGGGRGVRTLLRLRRAWLRGGCWSSLPGTPTAVMGAGVSPSSPEGLVPSTVPERSLPTCSLCCSCSLTRGRLAGPQLCPHRPHTVPRCDVGGCCGCEGPCGRQAPRALSLWEGNVSVPLRVGQGLEQDRGTACPWRGRYSGHLAPSLLIPDADRKPRAVSAGGNAPPPTSASLGPGSCILSSVLTVAFLWHQRNSPELDELACGSHP